MLNRVAQSYHFPESRERFRGFVLQHGIRVGAYAVIAVLIVTTFVVPLIQEFLLPRTAMDRLTLPQHMLFRFCETMTALFFLTIGLCVGSFLNVIVYRVPLRISVLVKPSFCPGCNLEIKGKDNMPLLGWLKLDGKCRNCGIPIPARYPIVELLTGLAFLLLYLVELISGGINLPGRSPNLYAGVLWILFYTKWDLVRLYLFHSILFCCLFSWGLIRRDGNRVPFVTFLVVTSLMAGVQFVWADLQLLAGLPTEMSFPQDRSPVSVLTTIALGLVAGFVGAGLHYMAWKLFGNLNKTSKETPVPVGPLYSWLLIGVSLGWQAVAGIFTVLSLISLIIRLFVPGDLSKPSLLRAARLSSLMLTAAFLIHQCLWRWISEAASFSEGGFRF